MPSFRAPVSSFPLVLSLALAVGLPVPSIRAQGSVGGALMSDVLVATGPDRTLVYHTEHDGLLVRRGDRWIGLGHGGEPRFAANGDLYFVRTIDDGHVELGRTLWRLRAGARAPERVLDPRGVPAYRAPMPSPSLAATKVCVDPGHGGTDPGALGNGLRETDINLDVALRLRRLLAEDTADTRGGGEWNVLMTRTTDTYVSLAGRTTAANGFGAASFVSIHMNAFSSTSANGTETFSYRSTGTGANLRNRLQAEALAAWGLRNRGNKTASFYVLRNTSMPAALVEGGFITNAVDSAKMRVPAERERLALGLLYALQVHHGYTRYKPAGGGGGQNGRLRGVLYNAAVGTTSRITGATVALPDGTFVTTSSTGYFEFTLPAGSRSYAATAAGFTAQYATRTVVANNDVWGSLGLRPGNVPSLSVTPQVAPNGNVTVSVRGDAGQSAVLLIHAAPAIPLVDLSAFGVGIAWPRLTGVATLALGRTNSSGQLSVRFRVPNIRNVNGHCQAVVPSRGAFRLTNGDAFAIR